MSGQDTITDDGLQLRKQVADRLGYTILYENEERGVLSGYPVGWQGEIVPQVPLWDRDLLAALGLMRHFNEYIGREKGFGIKLNMYARLSGSAAFYRDGLYRSDDCGSESFDDLTQDGPLAICKAFLQAMTQLDEVLKESQE